MSRKKTPEHIKLVRGTQRPDRTNKRAPVVDPIKNSIKPPETLDVVGKAKWQELIVLLMRIKVLTELDMHNLECFCIAYQNLHVAQRYLADNGPVLETEKGFTKNPGATLVNEAMRQIQTYGSNLGLDPSSRSRLVVAPPDDGKPKKEGFGDL